MVPRSPRIWLIALLTALAAVPATPAVAAAKKRAASKCATLPVTAARTTSDPVLFQDAAVMTVKANGATVSDMSLTLKKGKTTVATGTAKGATPAAKQAMVKLKFKKALSGGTYRIVVTGKRTELKVKPKFVDGRPVLTDLKRVSTPGRRHYVGSTEIPRVMSGLGISILSTSKGVMSGGNAKRQNLGGELIANVW